MSVSRVRSHLQKFSKIFTKKKTTKKIKKKKKKVHRVLLALEKGCTGCLFWSRKRVHGDTFFIHIFFLFFYTTLTTCPKTLPQKPSRHSLVKELEDPDEPLERFCFLPR